MEKCVRYNHVIFEKQLEQNKRSHLPEIPRSPRAHPKEQTKNMDTNWYLMVSRTRSRRFTAPFRRLIRLAEANSPRELSICTHIVIRERLARTRLSHCGCRYSRVHPPGFASVFHLIGFLLGRRMTDWFGGRRSSQAGDVMVYHIKIIIPRVLK